MEVLPYDAEIEIVEVVPEKGGPPLRWEAIHAGEEGKSKFRVDYPEPIPPGGKYGFRLVAKMRDSNAYFEDSAKLNFLYRTGHEVYVTLPRGYYPLYTDEPMELKLDNERVVLTSAGGRERPIVIFAVRCQDGKKLPPTPPPASAPSIAPPGSPGVSEDADESAGRPAPGTASPAPPDTIE
jgi:hypothetical protein